MEIQVPFDPAFLYALACRQSHSCSVCSGPLTATILDGRVWYNWQLQGALCVCKNCVSVEQELTPTAANDDTPAAAASEAYFQFQTEHARYRVDALGDCTMCKINSKNGSHAHAGFETTVQFLDDETTVKCRIFDPVDGKKTLVFEITDSDGNVYQSANQPTEAFKMFIKKNENRRQDFKAMDLFGLNPEFPLHRMLFNQHRLQYLEEKPRPQY